MRILILLLLTLLWSAPATQAEEALAVYDLKLFGYRLEMSYDEAVAIRAFHYTEFPQQNEITGVINSVYCNDQNFNIKVAFLNGRSYKIIGKFDPAEFEQVLGELKNSLGPGEDFSRSVKTRNNTTALHSLHKWAFPGARIDLVGISNQTDYATLSMISTTRNIENINP